MKKKVYLQISNIGKNVTCSNNPKLEPRYKMNRGRKIFLPTIQICLNLEIPDTEFDTARHILDINIQEAKALARIQVEEVRENENR